MPMEPWLESFARTNFRRAGDTAHDLKTPLNVAVLNLELLRMRVRRIAGENDEKLDGYASAIELELRRLGQIFDAFFLLTAPPKNDEPPAELDFASIAADAAGDAGLELARAEAAPVAAHESRMRQAAKLFFESAAKLTRPDGRRVLAKREDGAYRITVTGDPAAPELELTKIFKFYYTDPDGNPDLSLATARLIVETYGGELIALDDESDKVRLRLAVPVKVNS